MKLGTHKGKKIKAFTSIVFNWLFPDTIKNDEATIKRLPYILEDDYFDSVMMSDIKNPKNTKTVKDILKKGHIDVDYAAAFPIFFERLNPSSTDEDLRKKTLRRLRDLIDEAYYYWAKIFLICSGSDPGKDKRKKAKEKLVDSILELCRYCYDRKEDYLLKITQKTPR